MATPWCRLWSDMPNDPKWRTISKISKQPISSVIAVYVHLMVCASNATKRGYVEGWCDEDIATALDLETDQIAQIVSAMQGRVLEKDTLTGWEKRQPAREDGAAERAKLWRDKQNERKRTQTNANEQIVHCTNTANGANGVDTEVDTEDKKKKAFYVVFAENVKMTEEEHAKLVTDHGEAFTAACIAKLSNYKGASGKKYKSDYRAILTWVVDEVTKTFPKLHTRSREVCL